MRACLAFSYAPHHAGLVCTAILLHRPGAQWPLLLAANRDEMLDRPWQAPAPHWPKVPGVIGGLDTLAGGTWLGLNDAGVVGAVLNRTGSLGPLAGKRSRGALPLLALALPTAAQAAEALVRLDGGAWRSFNLLVADHDTAWFVRGLGEGPVQRRRLAPGLHMVTSAEPNDLSTPRIARHLPLFSAASWPDPPDWGAWPDFLADGDGAWGETLNVPPRGGFGTACAALIGVAPGRAVFEFAPGPPGHTPFAPVSLPPRPVSPAQADCYRLPLKQTAPTQAEGGV